MQVSNPLVPPQYGSSGAPAPVANAPAAADTRRHDSDRPVTANERSERPRDDDADRKPRRESRERGSRVDIRV